MSMGDKDKFSFSNVSDNFDDHISKSIRGYDNLRSDIIGMSKYFVEDGTAVVDIGCSQGSLLKKIKDFNTQVSSTQYFGFDINESFQKHWKDEDNLKYKIDDVRNVKLENMSLCISMFTFQFLPEKDRLHLMKNIYDNLVDGGAFITSEKIFSNNAKVQNMMDFLYYDFKRQSFSEKEILDKEQELRHLSKTTTENLLTDQLRNIGFRGVQIFWRNFNFIGVLAMKRPKESLDNE